MTRFDVIYADTKGNKERNNILSGEVVDFFNSLPWKESFQDCLKTEDAIYDYYFSVSYLDDAQLEQSFDLELFIDDESKLPKENQPLRFSLNLWKSEYVTKKIFFGLFGTKQIVKDNSIIMDDQNIDFAVKCLQAFVRLDVDYLRNNMYENFGVDKKDNL